MARADGFASLLDLGFLDLLARRDTWLNRLDPRVKVVVTLAFVLTVVSFDRYAVASLLPLCLFPALLLVAGELPVGYLFRKILVLLPFALAIALCNPFFDRAVQLRLGPLAVSGGWLSSVSLLIRFALTVSAGLVLVATTGFIPICAALERLGCPRVFAVQLLFLYRYLFLLGEEGERLVRARDLRSFGRRGRGARVFGPLAGSLLIRSWERAQRVHLAMLCRGFRGDFPVRCRFGVGRAELCYLCGWLAFFVAGRLVDFPLLIGGAILGGVR